MRRVVVTGLGVVAPNGVGKDASGTPASTDAAASGRSSAFDASDHPVKIAGEVHDFDPAPFIPDSMPQVAQGHGPGRPVRRRRRRAGRCRTAASRSANENPERVGVVMGTGLVPMDLAETRAACWPAGRAGRRRRSTLQQLPTRTADARCSRSGCLKYLPNMVAAHISMAFNAQGPNSTVTTACVAGTQAVGEAFRLVARGDADVMLAGGADSRIDPLLLLAYTALGTLSRADRPAARGSVAAVRPAPRRLRPGRGGRRARAGGAASGPKRAARTIYAEVLGLGSSFDAYSVTKPDPEGRGGGPRHPQRRWTRPASTTATSTTSTPTAPAPGSTT